MWNLRRIAEPTEGLVQLSTLKYLHADALLHCGICTSVITSRYYQINGRITVCPRCKSACAATEYVSAPIARMRGLIFGIVAAAAACVTYWTIMAATGYRIYPAVIAIGWLVGRAVSFGTCRRTGWSYQSMAALVAYLAVLCAHAPTLVQWLHDTWGPAAPPLLLDLFGLCAAWGLASFVPSGPLQNLVHLLCTLASPLIAWRVNAIPSNVHVMGPFRVARRTQSKIAA